MRSDICSWSSRPSTCRSISRRWTRNRLAAARKRSRKKRLRFVVLGPRPRPAATSSRMPVSILATVTITRSVRMIPSGTVVYGVSEVGPSLCGTRKTIRSAPFSFSTRAVSSRSSGDVRKSTGISKCWAMGAISSGPGLINRTQLPSARSWMRSKPKSVLFRIVIIGVPSRPGLQACELTNSAV